MSARNLPVLRQTTIVRTANTYDDVGDGSLVDGVQTYLMFKKRRLTPASERGYIATLRELVVYFGDASLSDFEPPRGTRMVEQFLVEKWGGRAGRTYNKNLSVLRDFFRWQVMREQLQRDPTLPIEKAKVAQVHRTTFSDEQRARILAVNPSPRDQIALRLLLDYGVRKGGLLSVRYGSFDARNRTVEVFTKGQKYHTIPVPDDRIWRILEDTDAAPDAYLMCRQVVRRRRPPQRAVLAEASDGLGEVLEHVAAVADASCGYELAWLATSIDNAFDWLSLAIKAASYQVVREFPTEPMGVHPCHDWWYRCLQRAGIVADGVTRGRKLHSARHTAGQRVLEKTGNLKAAQMLLGHANISTTGDVYVDWDADKLAVTMAGVLPSAELNDELIDRAAMAGRPSRRGARQ